MPRKWKGTLEDVVSPESLEEAWRMARAHAKRKGAASVRALASPGARRRLAASVLDGSWKPKPCATFEIVEASKGKRRAIEAPAFETKVVEQALLSIFRPQALAYLHPGMCGSMPGRGPERTRKVVGSWTRTVLRKRRWFVKADITKCFPSIEREVAMVEWRRHLADKRVAALVEKLHIHERGLPLGNAVSQVSANLVLDKIARETTKWTDKVVFQMDDWIAVFGNRRKAKAYLRAIRAFAERELHLEVKGASQVWDWGRTPVDIGGFKTYWDGRQRLRRKTYVKLKRAMGPEAWNPAAARSLMSRAGQLSKLDAPLLKKRIKAVVDKNGLRSMIGADDRRRRRAG